MVVGMELWDGVRLDVRMYRVSQRLLHEKMQNNMVCARRP